MRLVARVTRWSSTGDSPDVDGFKAARDQSVQSRRDQAPREGDPDFHVAQDDLHLPVGDRRVDLRDRHVVAPEKHYDPTEEPVTVTTTSPAGGSRPLGAADA